MDIWDCDVYHVDNLRSILSVMCVMWIVYNEVWRVVPRANVRFVPFVMWYKSLITRMLFTACRLDFWGYLCYNSIIQKNKEADSLSLANKLEQMF